jgi:uncharacterized membrane protein YkvA (DUF1232 family)
MKTGHLLDLFNVAKDWRIFVAMIKDKGYKIPLVRKLTYLLLAIYIISPFDFIPGIIPVVGIVDDLGAFAVILGLILYEIANYRDFLEEKKGRRTPRAEGEGKAPDTIRGIAAPRTQKGRK